MKNSNIVITFRDILVGAKNNNYYMNGSSFGEEEMPQRMCALSNRV